MKKIIISGHGGHLCEAYLESGNWTTGNDIEQAIGRLVRENAVELGFKIEVIECETTAYDRSDLNINDY